MKAALPAASQRRICRVLAVLRSSLREAAAGKPVRRPLGATLVERIRQLIAKHPTYGYRKLRAMLRFTDGLLINAKAVYRILWASQLLAVA